MKRMLPLLSALFILSFLLYACGSKTPVSATVQQADTTGMAEFNSWKKQQEFAEQLALYQQQQAKAGSARNDQSVTRQKTRTLSQTTSYPAKAPEKKGWSKAAKGTVIGAASGAVVGAVIAKKNRALGAVIGGVAGGGIGYGIGRHLDKKDGSR